MVDVVVDNDVLVKAAAFDILSELGNCTPEVSPCVSVLAAARYVCMAAIKKRVSEGNREDTIARLEAFLSSVSELEPTQDEVALAVEIEEVAAQAEGGLDYGESLLAAILMRREMDGMITGDKRAIVALANALASLETADAIAHKVHCFEQTVLRIADDVGCSEIRDQICAESKVDAVMSICFSCNAGPDHDCQCAEGLRSYISSLAENASPVLDLYGANGS